MNALRHIAAAVASMAVLLASAPAFAQAAGDPTVAAGMYVETVDTGRTGPYVPPRAPGAPAPTPIPGAVTKVYMYKFTLKGHVHFVNIPAGPYVIVGSFLDPGSDPAQPKFTAISQQHATGTGADADFTFPYQPPGTDKFSSLAQTSSTSNPVETQGPAWVIAVYAGGQLVRTVTESPRLDAYARDNIPRISPFVPDATSPAPAQPAAASGVVSGSTAGTPPSAAGTGGTAPASQLTADGKYEIPTLDITPDTNPYATDAEKCNVKGSVHFVHPPAPRFFIIYCVVAKSPESASGSMFKAIDNQQFAATTADTTFQCVPKKTSTSNFVDSQVGQGSVLDQPSHSTTIRGFDPTPPPQDHLGWIVAVLAADGEVLAAKTSEPVFNAFVQKNIARLWAPQPQLIASGAVTALTGTSTLTVGPNSAATLNVYAGKAPKIEFGFNGDYSGIMVKIHFTDPPARYQVVCTFIHRDRAKGTTIVSSVQSMDGFNADNSYYFISPTPLALQLKTEAAQALAQAQAQQTAQRPVQWQPTPTEDSWITRVMVGGQELSVDYPPGNESILATEFYKQHHDQLDKRTPSQ